MKKPAIAPVPRSDSLAQVRFDKTVKETLEVLTGARGGKIAPLPADAGLAAIVAKINEILDVMQ
jgi:hypothetical protein